MPSIRQRPVRFYPDCLPSEWHPLVKHIYASRLAAPDEYSKSLSELLSPSGIPGLETAVIRLAQALQRQERILIYGDYDVDGACATALMVRVLRQLGAMVDWFVPERSQHGYGLSIAGLSALPHLPNVVMTVDNGIQSHAAADWLAARHIDLIITDHHLPAETLPVACAVVNPHCLGSTFADRSLCGAGVAWYVLLALRRRLLVEKRWIAGLNLTDYLDLVALATIADVVPLSRNNRILVHYGLQRLRSGQGNVGLLALCAIANLSPAYISAEDCAFAIAPRLNAVGRLDDMREGIALLLSDDWQTAQDYAAVFDDLNRTRKTLENTMLHDALEHIDPMKKIASAFQPNWHEGVIGIVAGRVKSQLSRPALIATQSQDPAWVKASMRSLEGINLKSLLDEAATSMPENVLRYGGHAMAAGLSVERAYYPMLLAALEQAYTHQITSSPEVYYDVDGELPAELFDVSWAVYLEQLEPWGMAFPTPKFVNVFDILSCRRLGSYHSRFSLREIKSGRILSAVCFFHEGDYPFGTQARMVYSVQVNRFYGDERLSLLIEHIELTV